MDHTRLRSTCAAPRCCSRTQQASQLSTAWLCWLSGHTYHAREHQQGMHAPAEVPLLYRVAHEVRQGGSWQARTVRGCSAGRPAPGQPGRRRRAKPSASACTASSQPPRSPGGHRHHECDLLLVGHPCPCPSQPALAVLSKLARSGAWPAANLLQARAPMQLNAVEVFAGREARGVPRTRHQARRARPLAALEDHPAAGR